MASFIELIAKIKQKNNGDYALVDAEDIECEDGKRLNVVLNEKLDKNQGVENAGKTMVVGDDGNLVVGDSSPKNVYTKEEVDYLLNDKMDKPYYDIAITDDTTIENTLAGNFKMDSIEGSIYQAEESGIVPTPSRPVPINSRKVKAGDEYVELRSLKESINKFDLGLLSQTDLISQTGSYRKIEIPIKLKPNTKYKFYYEKSMIPALSWVVLNIINDTGKILIEVLNVDNKENNEVEKQAVNVAFTSPADGEIYFSYYVASYNLEGTLLPVNLTTFREKWFTKYVKNIMITEDSLNQNTYVPPTIRDHKIVDHTNKTAKIVRNVRVESFNGVESWGMVNGDNENVKIFLITNNGPTDSKSDDSIICNKLESSVSNVYYGSDNGIYRYSNTIRIHINEINTTNDFKLWLKSNPISVQYQLATPTEESIPYLEDDTSEVGLSWQDTTSPSPDIESKIYEVDEINIKLVNKNLIDYESKTKGYITNWNSVGNKISFAQTSNTDFATFVSYNVLTAGTNIIYKVSSNVTQRVMIVFTDNNDIILKSNYKSGPATTQSYSTTIPEKCTKIYICILDNGVYDNTKIQVQIEEGAEATPYEPHQETSIQHTLSKPIRKVNGFADIINILENKTYRRTLEIDVTSFTKWYRGNDSYDKENTTDRYAVTEETNKILQNKGISPILKNTQTSVWQKDAEEFTTNAGNQIHLSLNNDRLNITKSDTASERSSKFVEYINSLKGTGKELVYVPLSVAIEEPLEDELIQKLKTLKTFSSTTHVFVTGIAKPKLNAKYPKDIAAAQAQLEAKVITLQEAVIKNV